MSIQYISYLIFILSFCVSQLVVAQNRVDTLLNCLNDGGKSDHVMIFAHRGDWRSAPENSVLAFQKCIDEGIDGIEVDIQMTKDSVLVIMHDDTIDRTTTGVGKVSDYTLQELKALKLKSPIGVITRLTIPTLEEIFDLAKDKVLIQVDKWKPYKEQIIQLAKQHDCERQIIIRSTTSSDYNKKNYGELFENVIFMPVLVCKGKDDNEKLDDFMTNYKTPCIALSFTSTDFPVLNRIEDIKHKGYRVWLNSLWDTFNGGHDDELALTNPDEAYGWLLNKGANVIFSDNPMLLKKYLVAKGKRKF